MTNDGDDFDWADYETCPCGFCRHWDCNSSCGILCAKCGARCPDHDDTDHPFEEPEQ